MGEVLRRLARQRESEVEEGHLLVDHVHMMLSIPPKYSVAQVIGYIKGKSAIHIAREFAGRSRSFVGQHFGARGYFVSTLGLDERAIRAYIRAQELEDRRHEQLRLDERSHPEGGPSGRVAATSGRCERLTTKSPRLCLGMFTYYIYSCRHSCRCLKVRPVTTVDSTVATQTAAPETAKWGRETVFEAHDITKVYHMGEVDVYALRGVGLTLLESEFLVLLGPSGSGKSTLLNILGGLDVPTAGRVLYRGRDLTAAEERELTDYRRRHVGFVFQFYNLIPSLTALENVALVTDISEHPLAPAEALAMVDLTDRLDHFPAQLSGGEQQRVAIARAIAKRPDVLLCDEPTGALDISTGIVVLEAIDRINRELGTTTAVITHNAAVSAMADRVITLLDGRIGSVRTNDHKLRPRELEW